MTDLSEAQKMFDNRQDAGRKLAEKLTELAGKPVVVLAVPNGGVPVGVEVATALKADFDVVISRKIPMPLRPEAGFGAIADDGTIILNEAEVRKTGLSRQQIDFEASKVRAAIKQRSLLYKSDRPLALVSGRSVIIVDDGLASGLTMVAAVESVRHRRPKEIIVAVPVASALALKQVETAANRVVTCAVGFMPRFYISDFYRYWQDLKDDEVVQLLKQWRARSKRREQA